MPSIRAARRAFYSPQLGRMGVYDRQYYREESSSGLLSGRSMVLNLILVNVALFVLTQFVSERQIDTLFTWFGLAPDLYRTPWKFWQLVTYGFLHDHETIFHVGWNMFALWMFGTPVEEVYGPREFLRLYLTMLVFAGLVWLGCQALTGEQGGPLIGASGAVTGVVILFAMKFPHQTILLMFVIPVPAWIVALLVVFGDISGVINRAQHHPGMPTVAYTAHLAGAAFAFAYARSGWHLGSILPGGWSLKKLKLRPKLKIHNPTDEPNLSQQVDAILAKISREGEASLSDKERKTLQEASRRYQRRRE